MTSVTSVVNRSDTWMLREVPTCDQYADALRQLDLGGRINQRQRDILAALFYTQDRTASATELGQVIGCEMPKVNNAYGVLGHRISDVLGLGLTGHWWTVLSAGYQSTEGFMWEMYPTLADALLQLGWVTTLDTETDALTDESVYVEGEVRQRVVDVYERNLAARQACIDHYGPTCRVCEVDFSQRYGPIGEGYIQVHHLTPISQQGGAHIVDPIRDLSPVCPNCHAMLHRHDPPYTIDELREMMAIAQDGAK